MDRKPLLVSQQGIFILKERYIDSSLGSMLYYGPHGAEDFTICDEHIMQYTDVLWNWTIETYIVLLTNVTPIHFLKLPTDFCRQRQHICEMVGHSEKRNMWLLSKAKLTGPQHYALISTVL